MLMAEFDEGKTCVTQPRILPCRRTCDFVNGKLGGNLVGWESADNSTNPEARLVYVTDGLISARALGPGLLKSNYSIIAFDEVHERSKSIDTGLIGTALQVADAKKKGLPRPKIVIMSATLDKSCLIPFKNLGLKVSKESVKVKSPFTTTVDDNYRGKHFLTATAETYYNRKRIDEQILCFLPGTAEVNDAAAAFFDQTGVRAAVLSGQEDPLKMQELLETATVFFSTNIADEHYSTPLGFCNRFRQEEDSKLPR
jgi:HrpA-like RNA helicase